MLIEKMKARTRNCLIAEGLHSDEAVKKLTKKRAYQIRGFRDACWEDLGAVRNSGAPEPQKHAGNAADRLWLAGMALSSGCRPEHAVRMADAILVELAK